MKKWLEALRFSSYYRGSSLSALVMNLVFAEFVLFIAGYLWFVQRTKIPLLALILTLTLTSLLTIAFVLRYQKVYKKKKAEARRRLGREFMADGLNRLSSDEFQWQVMRLLLRLDGITNIQSNGEFLETTLQGKKTAIGCYHAGIGEKISQRRLVDFLNQAKLEGYSNAIYVTSGGYPETLRELEKSKSSLKIQLLDMDNLLDQMEGAGMFPDEKSIDGLLEKKIFNRRKKLQELKKEILTPKRIRTYLSYSLFFFVLSRMFRQMSLYYLLVSVVFLLLALLVWLYSRKRPLQSEEKELLPYSSPSQKSGQGS